MWHLALLQAEAHGAALASVATGEQWIGAVRSCYNGSDERALLSQGRKSRKGALLPPDLAHLEQPAETQQVVEPSSPVLEPPAPTEATSLAETPTKRLADG
jgi:hypothetical protein